MKPRLPHHILAVLFSLSVLFSTGTVATIIPVAGSGNGQNTIFLPVVMNGGSASSTPTLPAFNDFVASLTNGQADVARGVYVPGIMAYAIEQQPEGDAAYIAPLPSVVTKFQSAAYFGNTGLLAHNYLAGAQFFNLVAGQEVRLVYGDGSFRAYRISSIHRFQAVDPYSPTSNFVNLTNGATLSALEVFNQMYTGTDHVTFQTCIDQNGIGSWGRLFVIATPLS